jgi:hypothetical protein
LSPFLLFIDVTFSQIKDYRSLIDHISRVLCPGGLVEIMESDFCVYDLNHTHITVDTLSMEPPWLARWMAFMKKAARERGGDADAATHIHQWVCEHGDFEDIVYKEYWFPSGPFQVGDDETSTWWRKIGKVFRQDLYVGSLTSYN